MSAYCAGIAIKTRSRFALTSAHALLASVADAAQGVDVVPDRLIG